VAFSIKAKENFHMLLLGIELDIHAVPSSQEDPGTEYN
jgi:hypothetical protein